MSQTGDVEQHGAIGQLAAVLTERAAEDDEEATPAVAKPGNFFEKHLFRKTSYFLHNIYSWLLRLLS